MAFPATTYCVRGALSRNTGETQTHALATDLGEWIDSRAGEFSGPTTVEIRITPSANAVEGMNNPSMVFNVEFS